MTDDGRAYSPPNWIEGPNPFKLATPSPWWLRLLHEYDPQLLVFPSQKDACYRLARRVRREARMGLNALVLHTHPDTVVMIREGAVAVSTLTPWATRSDKIIRDLMGRDMWRHGGAEGVLQSFEDAERRDERVQAARDSQDAEHVAGEAYRSLKVRKGERLFSGDRERGRRGRVSDRRTQIGLSVPRSPFEKYTSVIPAGLPNYKTVSSVPPEPGKRPTPDVRITLTDPS